ncbi:replication-relaxation family protein [Rossellomorea aquimaris]|uniref:replication-relaxation family protein n=1 Tax=Rossellomorea aquimaris TaxID=189382 RepID=UPI001CD482C9|nr:replication-relaxation family protein [Rossellomorea aquimaris]MCA1058134.1 replication-relaxation family protein [Rossellomorea aquimaris]
MNKELLKQQRHENILLSLKKLDYLSRSQIQKIHRLKSTRNANRVLKDMSEYLSSFRHGENIYYLNKKGRELVKTQKVCKKTAQVNHYLMRNTLYISLGCPATWKNEIKLKVKDIQIVCDAIYEVKDTIHIIEVDHTQKMMENKRKIEKYREIVKLTGKVIKFHWITTTHNRQKQLLELSQGLNVNVSLAHDYI